MVSLVIKTRSDLESYLAADLRAQGLERWRLHYRIRHRAPYFQRVLRKTEYWTNTARTPFGHLVAHYLRLRLKFLTEKFGIGISPNCFGPGLSVAHIGWVHVHHKARIGANCRIHQGVTIGEGRLGQYPTVGDDVFIFPGAMIIGADVGSRVGIYAGAVVTKSVPDDVDVAGVPARITNDRRPSQVASAAG